MIINLYQYIVNFIKDKDIKLSKDTDLVEIRYSILKELIKYGKLFNTNVFDHKLYPLVSERGRPLISWNECAHLNCSKCFSTCKELRSHLETHKTYKHGYSRAHETCETKYHLNSNDNKYYCASGLCTFSTLNESDMIKHYKLLGIEPFYKQGETIDPSEYIEFSLKNNFDFKKINILNSLTESIDLILKHGLNAYEDSDCCICMSSKSDILLLPCKHKVMCKGCFSKLSNKKCPMCKNNYNTKLVINTDITFYHP